MSKFNAIIKAGKVAITLLYNNKYVIYNTEFLVH